MNRKTFFLSGLMVRYGFVIVTGLAMASPVLANPVSSDAQADTNNGKNAITSTEVPATAINAPSFDSSTAPAVVQELEQHGVDVVGRLNVPGGLKAYAGIAKQQPLAIYVTPDEKYIIIGTMMNEKGEDLTQGALEQATIGPWTQKTWEALRKSAWVIDGDPQAPRTIYVFTDPNCPFCHNFWLQARPWVESGAVQIHHILVGILTANSPGKAAAILAADDPARALSDHESAGPDQGITPLDNIPQDIADKLANNKDLMDEFQIQGTPGILYFDANQQLQIQRGAPLDQDLEEILGPR